MVSASGDGTAKLWDLDRGCEIFSLKGHTSAISSVAFSPDGKRIVSAGYDNSVKVWMPRRAAIHSLVGHTGFVNSAAFNPPDGKRIVSASHDKTVKVWDAEGGSEILTLKGHTSNVTCAVFSVREMRPARWPGDRVVSGSWDKTVRVWDAARGTAILTLNGHTHNVHSVACSPDGKRIVSGGQGDTVKVWDAECGGAAPRSRDTRVRSTVWPSARMANRSSAPARTRPCASGIGTRVPRSCSLKGHTDAVNSVAISSNGTRIVTGCHDTTVKVWDARQDSETCTLRHTIGVRSVAIRADGKRLVSASMDRTAKVWDADTGADLHRLLQRAAGRGPDLPTERVLVTAANDGKLHVWDADTGAERSPSRATAPGLAVWPSAPMAMHRSVALLRR